jgi:formamidopyrimidine-DNA glycosylase
MGQLYLVEDPRQVAEYANLGPEALEVSEEEFRARLKSYRGEIKGILTRGESVAGIGNAYSDEILWAAQLHPFRKRTQLTPDEISRLYQAMRSTLLETITNFCRRCQPGGLIKGMDRR